MVGPLSRRTFLHGGIATATMASAGCMFFGPDTEYQPVTVRNQRESAHDVELVFDRGDAYSRKRRETQLSPDGEERFDEFIPSSDWDYPYRLETHVDGDHVETTPHRWERTGITVTLVPDEAVQITNVEPNDMVTTATDQPTEATKPGSQRPNESGERSPSGTQASPSADS